MTAAIMLGLAAATAVFTSRTVARYRATGMTAGMAAMMAAMGTGLAAGYGTGTALDLGWATLVGVLAGVGGRTADFGGGSAEARRRAGLANAANLDEGAAGGVVRVVVRLADRKHRREADIRAFHQCAPLVTRLLLE